MAANKTLLILPGDGIGVEVMGQVRRIVDWFDRRRAIGFDILEQPVGGAAYDAHGTPLSDWRRRWTRMLYCWAPSVARNTTMSRATCVPRPGC
jgi:isocitrate/isopropylmalate dehydrogenase